MNKVRVSLRLDIDLVKRIDARKTKTKSRNDVITEMLYSSVDQLPGKNNDQARQQKNHAELLSKGAKASVMLLKMAELALKRHSDQANEIINKTQTHYQDEIKALISESQLEII